MFNPKGQSLLEEQLAFSGLEMNWGFAAIAAGASILGGISGRSQAKKSNKRAKEAEKKQREHNEKVAKLTNEHNAKLDQADKANYYAMRDYSHETSMKNWKRGKEIQDFKYLNELKQFEKSNAIGNQQLGLNAEGMAVGIESEQNVIQEAFIHNSFQQQQNLSALKQAYFENRLADKEAGIELQGIGERKLLGQQAVQDSVNQLMSQNALQKESAMVESLIAEGQAQLGQAGKSTMKGRQASKAALHRGLMALESELSGKYKQAALQLAELNVESSLATVGVGLNLQRIDNAIENAEAEAMANAEVMAANMASQIRTSQNNLQQMSLERKVADVNTKAGMMLFPEKLSYDPAPTKPPERIFVDRMKAIPGFVPPAQQQSTWAPLISGIGNAASSLAGADFSKNFFGQ